MAETEEKKNIVDGEEGEEDYLPEEVEVEGIEEEIVEIEEEEEVQNEDEIPSPEKHRRCQKRRKVRQRRFNTEEEDEEEEELNEGEDEGEEGEEEENLDDLSFTSSVLSAISFVWEDEVYEFQEMCDHGRIDNIYTKQYVEEIPPDEIGVSKYLDVCKVLNINPSVRVLQSLNKEEIDFSYRNIHGGTIRAMCAALETNNIVKRLILKFNRLKPDDCLYIGRVLRSNEKISHLDFTGCRIGPEGLKSLISHLYKNEFIVYLNLSKCDIGDEGMKMLSHVLIRNNSIQKLDLSYNRLSDGSGDALGLSLKLNTSITHLILRYNNLFDPQYMKGFYRSLTFNTSISYLDLSWNGLNGVDMAMNIANYLRRSESIIYLDLSDNRFEGVSVVTLKKGLAKSRNLETLKLGKNPMLPEDLDVLLSGANGCYNLKFLDLEDLWVKKSFFKILKKIQSQREFEVNIAGVLSDYEVFGPDYPKIILERAQFEAQKPKSEKMRKDFGHLMWTLGDEPLTPDEFMERVKKFKAKINKELFPELMKQFTLMKLNMIDVVAMRQKYLSIFPDSTPPPPPVVKGKKGVVVQEEVAPVQQEQEKEKEKVAEPIKEKGEVQPAEGFDEGGEDEEGELIIGDAEEVEEELALTETVAEETGGTANKDEDDDDEF